MYQSNKSAMTDKEYFDFVDFLEEEGRSWSSVLHVYRQGYRAGSGTIHLFFEGIDDKKYYMPYVRSQIENLETQTYVCNGKTDVLRLRDEIYINELNDVKILFFVDKDFDDLLDQLPGPFEDLFVTEFYSIENYLASEGAIRIIFDDFLNINKSDKLYEEVISAFAKSREQFGDFMRPIIAWALCLREDNIRPRLDKVSIGGCFKIAEDLSVSAKPNFVSIFRRACEVGEPQIGDECIEKWERRLLKEDVKIWLRGKYEVWHFAEFLRTLIRTLRKKQKKGTSRLKVPKGLEGNDLFETLGARLPQPKRLQMFLESHLRSLV